MAFSLDLRKRIRSAFFDQKKSKADIIRQYEISRTGLDYLIALVHETGSIEPRPHGKGRPPVLQPSDIEIIKKFIDKNSDATLEEIWERLDKKGSITSVFRTLEKIGYRLKKSHYTPASKIEKM
jgi:transposase